MNMKSFVAILSTVLISAAAPAVAQADRFVQKFAFPSGETVVVAEGDFEPRSVGSFSVRLYSGANPQFPTDDFVAGFIHERAGFIDKALIADVDGDGRDELLVVIRSVGTGAYMSAHAFVVARESLALKASIADLSADADPVTALKKAADEGK